MTNNFEEGKRLGSGNRKFDSVYTAELDNMAITFNSKNRERVLVYEYMAQGALRKHLIRGTDRPLTWIMRLVIALDVAKAMKYLHRLESKKFVHQELNLSNILLDSDFRAKVSEFGYGDHQSIKADVYSYGVVLLNLLTGLFLFSEESPEDVERMVGSLLHAIEM
ncbi:hypothetical protein ACFE04_028176 [Oxalis oulophora]